MLSLEENFGSIKESEDSPSEEESGPSERGMIKHSTTFFPKIEALLSKNTLGDPAMNHFSNRRSVLTKRHGIQANQIMAENKLRTLSHDELVKAALKNFKKSTRTFEENQVIIHFLSSLESFTQGIREVKKEASNDLISKLSFTFKYLFKEKNCVIYHNGDPADKFYLILEGKVDVLVPNDETMMLHEIEYFYYLLQLRKYGEVDVLNHVLENNNDNFPMNEKSFDIWIKMAHQTIVGIQKEALRKKKEKEKESQDKSPVLSSSNRRVSLPHANAQSFGKRKSVTRSPLKSPSKLKTQKAENVKPFEDTRSRDLSMQLEKEVTEVYNVITGRTTVETKTTNVNTDEYIHRIYPVILEGRRGLERRKALITKYSFAQSMKEGEKFGEFSSEKFNLENLDSHPKRIETVISSKDSHFGILTSKEYNELLRDINEHLKREQINFLFCMNIFDNCNRSFLLENFCNFFNKKIFKYKDILYNENDQLKNSHMIYFIKEGEFMTRCKKSTESIDSILLESSMKRKIDQHELDFLERNKDYFLKQEMKLQCFGNNDIMGLEDCFWKNKYLFTVQCNCSKAVVYEINITFFKRLLNLDKVICENVKQLQILKMDILLKMLYSQRKARVSIINAKSSYDANSVKVPKGKTREKIKKFKVINRNSSVSLCKKPEGTSDISLLSKKIKKGGSKHSIVMPNLIKMSPSMFNNTTTASTLYTNEVNNTNTFRSEGVSEQESGIRSKSLIKMKILHKRRPRKLDSILVDLENLNEKEQAVFGSGKHPPKKNENSLSFGCTFEDTMKKLIDHENKKVFFEMDPSKQRKAEIIDPLEYDNFNRSYNTFYYYNSNKKDSKEEKIYDIRLLSSIKRMHIVSEKKPPKFAQKKSIVTTKLRRIYNKKYNKLITSIKKN